MSSKVPRPDIFTDERTYLRIRIALAGILIVALIADCVALRAESAGPVHLALSIVLAAIPLTGMLVLAVVERFQRAAKDEIVRVVEDREALRSEMNERISEWQAVAGITNIMHSSLNVDEIAPVVLDTIGKALDVGACSLQVVEKHSSETLFAASSSGRMERLGSDRPIGDPFADCFECTTVYDQRDVMVLFCASAQELERLTDDDRLVMSALCGQLVVAVENSRLYRLTRKLATTDELTGLSNYRQLQHRLESEVDRARRYNKPVSLVMFDVDDFKRFNDTFGHPSGDAALRDLSEVLRGVIREVDFVARYGGEEFAIILPETDASGAYVAAEKVRDAIANHQFTEEGGAPIRPITISAGVASYPEHARDKESLLRQADNALYEAKNHGRNRVRTALAAMAVPIESDGE